MKHQFTVNQSEGGSLLEPFLYKHVGTWSHKMIKQAIDRNKVTVNGKRIFVRSWFLNAGDRVEVGEMSELRSEPRARGGARGGAGARESRGPEGAPFGGGGGGRASPKGTPPRRGPLWGSGFRFVQVVYEDDSLLVTNKPPFVDYDSFIGQVNDYLKRTLFKQTGRRIDHVYLGQMHRLDRETSGLLIFTKKKSANVLSDQFRFREMKKFYLAIVAGRLEQEHGFLDEKIEKGHFGSGKKAAIVSGEGGKESATEYWVRERYSDATLVRLQIHTGRTHQIRVHMAHQGHPVLGDKLYGRRSPDSPEGAPSGLLLTPVSSLIKRQMLHAYRMEFRHPLTKAPLRLEAPLPKDMVDLIDRFRVTG